jgi:hypothetical protein
MEPLGVVDERGIEFDLQVHGGSTRAVILISDLA